MKIVIQPDLQAMSGAAADEIARQIRIKPDSVLGFATGNTTIGLHTALVNLSRSGEIDFSRVVTFNLDEYVGLPREHPLSCYARMETQLFRHIPVARENVHMLDGQAISLAQECQAYEQQLRHHGGIDLQVLGIGLNGHIGFNEPGTSFESITHVAEIAPGTRDVKGQSFGSAEQVPRLGITMGIKTIMQAREILLLAGGGHKAEIVQQALTGPLTPELPASVLQLHPNLVVILEQSLVSAAPLLRTLASKIDR